MLKETDLLLWGEFHEATEISFGKKQKAVIEFWIEQWVSYKIKKYPFTFLACFRKCLFQGFSWASFELTQNGNLSQGTETFLPIIASPMLWGPVIFSAGWMNMPSRDQHLPSQREETTIS